MLNVLVIRLGLERGDDDNDVKTGGQGRGAARCQLTVQFITRLQVGRDGGRWIDRQGKKEKGEGGGHSHFQKHLFRDFLLIS